MFFTMYAIRRIDTEKYIPYEYISNGTRTIRDPTEGVIPALFIDSGAAQLSINMWAKGRREWYEGSFIYNPIPGRNANDLEIIEVRCIIHSPIPKPKPKPTL